MLNYLNAPNVYVWSAALASCSLPLILGPTIINAKTKEGEKKEWFLNEKEFYDGSISADVPR